MKVKLEKTEGMFGALPVGHVIELEVRTEDEWEAKRRAMAMLTRSNPSENTMEWKTTVLTEATA